ncbi:glutathione S-transferase [Alteromonas sp. ZYF713]|nr:glutathione S-transferase [Alteromonas sp. ZYF713]
MLTLFASPGACSQISLILLEKANAHYQLKCVRLSEGEHNSPAYRAINPKGKVPALQSGEALVTETPAIQFYLHRQFPQAKILSAVDEITLISDLAWFASYVHPLITRYCKPELCGVSRDMDGVKNNAARQLEDAFNRIEDHLNVNVFWNGDAWDGLDIYLFWTINRLRRGGFSFAPFDRISYHYQQLLSDPVIKRALLKEKAL